MFKKKYFCVLLCLKKNCVLLCLKKNVLKNCLVFFFCCFTFALNAQAKANYCSSKSDFPWHEWIGKIQIGERAKTSEKSIFSDFTDFSFNLQRNKNTEITLTSAFSYSTYDEYWSIWIDYNQNGVFDLATETAFQGSIDRPADGVAAKNLNGILKVPPTANIGIARMRVSMKRGGYPNPCEVLPFGEVEDFLVNIEVTTSQKPAEKPTIPKKEIIVDKEENKPNQVQYTQETKYSDPNHDLFIFPSTNPKIFTLIFPETLIDKKVEVTFFNKQGVAVLNEKIKVGSTRNQTYDLSKKPIGEYVIEVKNVEGNTEKLRISFVN
jgi:GEVED domain